ncbi:MAG: metal-responsive CopG/Arc/MetJ family transcriptional regulator, partial [Alteromonadaceae bacterium]
QVKRDKNNGLKRVEFKLHRSLFNQLEQLAQEQDISRSELIETLLVRSLKTFEN